MLCFKSLEVGKKYNIEKHYKTFHYKMYGHIFGEERSGVLTNLKQNFLNEFSWQEPNDKDKSHSCSFNKTFLLKAL